MKKKVVLAFGGGLDTSYCAIYLSKDLDLEVHSVIVDTGGFSKEELEHIFVRLNVSTHQASEIVWKTKWITRFLSNLVLIDSEVVDTALGQLILMEAQNAKIPVWAVGVSSKLSPIAPYYLKGVLFPADAEDLVKLVCQEFPDVRKVSDNSLPSVDQDQSGPTRDGEKV